MTKKDKELTPMMKQFFDLKAQHPDAVLLFVAEISTRHIAKTPPRRRRYLASR